MVMPREECEGVREGGSPVRTHLLAPIGLIGACTLGAHTANASVTSVVVDRNITFKGPGVHHYRYVEATLNGSIDRPAPNADGTYSVGMVLIFPTKGGNGVGVVDWPNSVFYSRYGYQPREDMTIQFTQLTTDGYLFERGYTYASVQWNKEVTELFGSTIPPDLKKHNRLVYGTIQQGPDAWEILRDAARFLKNPTAWPGRDGPAPVQYVLSSGFSQSASLQNEFVSQGQNLGTYDGFLAQMIGLVCWERNNTPPGYGDLTPCDAFPNPGRGKMMVLATESDMQIFFGVSSRGDGTIPNYIQYELPGVSHLPTAVIDVSSFGATRQNPADVRPFVRGAFRNLKDWVKHNVAPPPAFPMEGAVDAAGNFIPDRDADGNALGGIRLPHMPTTLDPSGLPAGAPLGAYGGIEPAGLPSNLFLILGGTFDPFSQQQLEKRYPNRTYELLISRAADHLFDQGYIIEADLQEYKRTRRPLRLQPTPR
jgi:Alpha/beta hydrolase domain